MVRAPLSYALITPARNEAENLGRLAASVTRQTVTPAAWIVVENGSTDGTLDVANALSEAHAWIRVVSVDDDGPAVRGAPIVHAFRAGLATLPKRPDVVVNLDADVSMEVDFFERLLAAFVADPSLGIASGSAYELENGVWRRQFTTRTSVRGATRAYRWECLADVAPLEERLGWDGIDELKANVRGWRTGEVPDLSFRHHRRVGERDGSSRVVWLAEGELAHYMGYRPSYLVLRTLHRARQDPAALALLWGFARASLRREERCADGAARSYLRDLQRVRHWRTRAREALGRVWG